MAYGQIIIILIKITMGLDMYLTRKKYISFDDREKLQITGITGIRANKVKYIEEEAGYWRKANAIHKWFVDNVQSGEDDCKDYYCSNEDLKALLLLVDTVLNSSKMKKAKIQNGTQWTKEGGQQPIMEDGELMIDDSIARKLLPTTEGCFFGSQDYNQFYIADLKETKQIIEEALKVGGEHYYSSSW
jgi:hypothetical protein